MIRSTVAILTISVLCACSSFREPLQVPADRVFLDDQNQLHFFGKIKQTTVDSLLRLFNEAGEKPRKLIISSEGGDIEAGMRLGNWVYDNNIVVSVGALCVSSCANYVITAAKHVQLRPDSVLAWHGSSWQDDLNQQYLEGNEHIVRWRNQEIAFFSRIGVSYRITVEGFAAYSAADYFSVIYRGPILGFDYSIEDMAVFGMDSIEEIDGTWNWRAHTDCCHVVRAVLESDWQHQGES